jgi:hypothetical protein
MGISLNGLTPAGTYPGLIKTGDNTAISGTPKVLSDGLGNDLPMAVSTTAVNFTNQLQQGGVAVPTASQVAAKQDTLVSGTNIKTINGTSVLGSGNIVTPSTPPSGVAGAIQFSNGSAFASDAANFFWDDTNNRLGVGTNTPAQTLDVNGVSNFRDALLISTRGRLTFGGGFFTVQAEPTNGLSFVVNGNRVVNIPTSENLLVGNNPSDTARLSIKGSGSTSATTSLLVQNSAGSESLKVSDNRVTTVYGLGVNSSPSLGQVNMNLSDTCIITTPTSFQVKSGITDSAVLFINGNSGLTGLNTTSPNASSAFDIVSTTRGFLPPRMTTTQKNAIASPAAGLVLYDSTTNKLQCYNGSTWNDLF